MALDIPRTLEEWNARGAAYLPGHLELRFTKVGAEEVEAAMRVRPEVLSWNGYLHAGAVVTLADSCCGYGTVAGLPAGATGFTTMNLTSNFLGTALKGEVTCRATPLHKGRTSQVWDAAVSDGETGKLIAQFRCTQLILWPR